MVNKNIIQGSFLELIIELKKGQQLELDEDINLIKEFESVADTSFFKGQNLIISKSQGKMFIKLENR